MAGWCLCEEFLVTKFFIYRVLYPLSIEIFFAYLKNLDEWAFVSPPGWKVTDTKQYNVSHALFLVYVTLLIVNDKPFKRYKN